MVKAKEFWDYLCNELDYRFFSGVPCDGLKPLYDTMNIDFMYYVPAVNENVALGMSSGARLAGTKSAILLNIDNIYTIYNHLFNFNIIYKIPVLIIAYKGKDSKINIGMQHKEMSEVRFKPGLNKFIETMEKEEIPGVFVIKEGILE
jgi:sulfopyruvate decarboxylase TPP-binding subunit